MEYLNMVNYITLRELINFKHLILFYQATLSHLFINIYQNLAGMNQSRTKL